MACTPAHLEAARKWRQANPEKVKAATSAWRERNPERVTATKTAWTKQWRAEHPEERKALGRSAWGRRRDRRRAAIDAVKVGGCKQCGEAHPAVLDFHHRNPAEKRETVSNLLFGNAPMAEVLAEAAKCDLLCANCHRKAHWRAD